ncbi:MAG: hypothetical protein GOV00_00500 [Candidatus Altiarchaeota archaeon]|nr:hypothetical protein [Candidatus Altiarchaeota archaeon]
MGYSTNYSPTNNEQLNAIFRAREALYNKNKAEQLSKKKVMSERGRRLKQTLTDMTQSVSELNGEWGSDGDYLLQRVVDSAVNSAGFGKVSRPWWDNGGPTILPHSHVSETEFNFSLGLLMDLPENLKKMDENVFEYRQKIAKLSNLHTRTDQNLQIAKDLVFQGDSDLGEAAGENLDKYTTLVNSIGNLKQEGFEKTAAALVNSFSKEHTREFGYLGAGDDGSKILSKEAMPSNILEIFDGDEKQVSRVFSEIQSNLKNLEEDKPLMSKAYLDNLGSTVAEYLVHTFASVRNILDDRGAIKRAFDWVRRKQPDNFDQELETYSNSLVGGYLEVKRDQFEAVLDNLNEILLPENLDGGFLDTNNYIDESESLSEFENKFGVELSCSTPGLNSGEVWVYRGSKALSTRNETPVETLVYAAADKLRKLQLMLEGADVGSDRNYNFKESKADLDTWSMTINTDKNQISVASLPVYDVSATGTGARTGYTSFIMEGKNAEGLAEKITGKKIHKTSGTGNYLELLHVDTEDGYSSLPEDNHSDAKNYLEQKNLWGAFDLIGMSVQGALAPLTRLGVNQLKLDKYLFEKRDATTPDTAPTYVLSVEV